MTEAFDIGDGVRITATFTNLDGVLDDPSTVTFKLIDPHGALTTPQVVRTGTGLYYGDFDATIQGVWFHRWEGTGLVQAAEEGEIFVRSSRFSGL